ncbi:MAG: riboflavin biosynthesis protein RibF [Cytophagales bacterium CG18_big_fil_WC_8_21_14_2_50_42_9]|nr:MAG: riboflavin biosynthesis protein RibF [Cytophagales bacterium CG18_big_fil_WC_8_21_14_2_50_42_9]
MQVIRDIREFPQLSQAVVTSGTFDGVHVGHQKIIQRLINRTRETKGQSVVITYWPHPRIVLNPGEPPVQLLSTIEERIAHLNQFPIDYLLIIPFTREFASLNSQQYIQQILLDAINTKELVIGYDHRFGKNREGSFAYLQQHAPTLGFTVEEIPAEDIDHVTVSSTKIRHALEKGDIRTANAYLGHAYSLTGKVVPGKKLGRTIGYPTANIEVPENYKLIPGQGIYAVRVQVNDKTLGGMLSIGTNPTVGGTQQTIEVHIFDFDGDIYEQNITLYFVGYIRPEEHFGSLGELKEKLATDQTAALVLLKAD